MDTTPVTHRLRSGRKGIRKSSSTPVNSVAENLSPNTSSASSINQSPYNSTPNTNGTPSTGACDTLRYHEKLSRSALRRELLLEDDEDEFMMPCTQLPIPGANGEVFWNSNASPTTARAKVELEKKLGRPDNKAMKPVESKHQAPSPLLTIPMLHTRRKINPRAKEEEIAKDIERKKEADSMLNSMVQIFQAEVQKHQTQLKAEAREESGEGTYSSSGSSTDRYSESHLHCSSNGSTTNERSDDKNKLKSKLSDQFDLVINTQSQSLLKDPDEGQDNISLDNLVSDDDSFMLKATQAIETQYNDSDKQCSFQKQLPLLKKDPPKSKDILAQSSPDIITEKTIHKTDNGKILQVLPLSMDGFALGHNAIRAQSKSNHSKEHSTILSNKNLEHVKPPNTVVFDDDEFDIFLSQIAMPEAIQTSTKTINTNVTSNIENISTETQKSSFKNPGITVVPSESKAPLIAKKVIHQASKTNHILSSSGSKAKIDNPALISDNNFKRFKSAPGAAVQENHSKSNSSFSKTKSFGQRSYSTPDASNSNKLPGGRDLSIKLSQEDYAASKPRCTKEEIEHKRLEALKKREIERKRQEAIRIRQLNSQKKH